MTSAIHESGDIIDRANKANIVVSAVDARAFGTPPAYTDAATPSAFPPHSMQYLTTGSGCRMMCWASWPTARVDFLHDRNDIEQSLLRAATDPEVSVSAGVYTRNI